MAGSDPALSLESEMIWEGKPHVEKSPEEALPETDLSEAIDPDEVTATVQDGTFEISDEEGGPLQEYCRQSKP
jgi:hypothetical protein